MALYEKGHVRIHYQEAGSGFPLFVIPGGGQNSTIGFMSGEGRVLPVTGQPGLAMRIGRRLWLESSRD